MDKSLTPLLKSAELLANRLLGLLPDRAAVDWQAHRAAVWHGEGLDRGFALHPDVDDIALDDLLQIDDQKARLIANTRQFLAGHPANNALLWGARGTGKSSLIHALLNAFGDQGLRLVEVNKSQLAALPDIVGRLREEPYRFVLFCDDLSFEADDASYKVLKSALEGSIFKSSGNILIYATSNRRHLLPETMADKRRRGHPRRRTAPRRGGGGKDLALRPLRPLARLPPLPAGRLLGGHPPLAGGAGQPARHDSGLERRTARRGAALGTRPGRAQRQNGAALRQGLGRTAVA